MKLVSLIPISFGKFHVTSPITLKNGLNIILGENEAGKSTLAAFITGMFYGFKKEGKIRISRTPEFERYRPWQGKDYQGVLVFEEEGRCYRLERSFDPDIVRIFDEVTGEDITKSYTQDSRKEFDIPKRHLGLSQREFKNTIWIGQLQSPQEPGFSTELQNKLESILEGGTEDVSVAKAVSLLSDEKAKIKTPRSTKAKLDILSQDILQLEEELRTARSREAQIRSWLIESVALKEQKAGLEKRLVSKERELELARYVLLKSILSQVSALEFDISRHKKQLTELSWAKDLPQDAEESFTTARHDKELLTVGYKQMVSELEPLTCRKEELKKELESLAKVKELDLDESKIASLYSRYVSAKATVTRGERSANEARKELRALEEELKTRGYYDTDFDESILHTAEENQNTCILAEKEKARIEVELEKARAVVASRNPGGAAGWIYGLSIGILGIAIVLTIMGLPISVPTFGVAVFVFGMGVFRHKKIAGIKAQDAAELKRREEELAEQVRRVETAKAVLGEFLAAAKVRSVEELRAKAREISSAREKLKRFRDRYSMAHDSWFEAAQEFSAVEKEFRRVLEALGCLAPGEIITDQGVDQVKKKVTQAVNASREFESISNRIKSIEGTLKDYRRDLERVSRKEQEIFSASGVADEEEFLRKIAANAEYGEAYRAIREAQERQRAILSGRTVLEVHEEVSLLERSVDPSLAESFVTTQSEYERGRKDLDALRVELSEVNTKLAALENGIDLRSAEGRRSNEIEEDLARAHALEQELSEDREALELAQVTLEELSRSIHKEFAPQLNRNVGGVLSQITGDRYFDVRVSPNLEMNVIYPETGLEVPISSLSGGTIDQCYFALRVAIAEMVTKKRDFPLFLDDPFVQYDDVRLRGVLRVLASLAERHQIVLFSCHGREKMLSRELGLKFNLVNL